MIPGRLATSKTTTNGRTILVFMCYTFPVSVRQLNMFLRADCCKQARTLTENCPTAVRVKKCFFFYEKVVKVKADVAAHLTFLVFCGLRHISAENFALGSLRSDDWQLGRPTAARLLSAFPRIQSALC
jgi:hypothetical protein